MKRLLPFIVALVAAQNAFGWSATREDMNSVVRYWYFNTTAQQLTNSFAVVRGGAGLMVTNWTAAAAAPSSEQLMAALANPSYVVAARYYAAKRDATATERRLFAELQDALVSLHGSLTNVVDDASLNRAVLLVIQRADDQYLALRADVVAANPATNPAQYKSAALALSDFTAKLGRLQLCYAAWLQARDRR